MDGQDFNAVVELDINAPVEKVWDSLTNPDVVKKYLHNTNVVTDWKVGSTISWHGEWNGKLYVDKGIVLDFEPNKILRTTHWSPMSGSEDKPENYHVVTYQLTPVADGTHLVLTQSNNATQEVADSMAEIGWLPILQKMKSLLEA